MLFLQAGGTAAVERESGAVIELKGVDIVTPKGTNVAQALTIRVTPETPLLVRIVHFFALVRNARETRLRRW